MGTLQFIDSMTGRLAWPLAAIVLGLIFRRSLAGLLGRVKKLRWGDREADLAELTEATQNVQRAAEEAAKPLPEDVDEGERENHERLELLIKSAISWGFYFGKSGEHQEPPDVRVEWIGDKAMLFLAHLNGARMTIKDIANVTPESVYGK